MHASWTNSSFGEPSFGPREVDQTGHDVIGQLWMVQGQLEGNRASVLRNRCDEARPRRVEAVTQPEGSTT